LLHQAFVSGKIPIDRTRASKCLSLFWLCHEWGDMSKAFVRATHTAVFLYLTAFFCSMAAVLLVWWSLYLIFPNGAFIVDLFLNFVLYNIVFSSISYPERKRLGGIGTGSVSRIWEGVCGRKMAAVVRVGFMDGPPNASVSRSILGRRESVYCSHQLLNSSRSGEVAGVLAHELGHLKVPLGMRTLAAADVMLFGAFRLYTMFFADTARYIFAWRPKNRSMFALRSIALWISVFLATLCFPLSGLLAYLAREHAADMFAASLGHAPWLAHWLDRRVKQPRTLLWSYLAWISTHPPSYVRARVLRRVAYAARWEQTGHKT
jgi:Zn-dependent protease with chaperone function